MDFSSTPLATSIVVVEPFLSCLAQSLTLRAATEGLQ